MKSTFLTAALAVLVPACVWAEGQPLSFEEVARDALSRGPEAAKIGGTLAERAAEAFSIRVKENPLLNVSAEVPVDRPTSGREDTGVSVTLSQTIRPSDFGQRAALASLIRDAADAEQALALNELLANLSIVYARAWLSQETETLLRDARARVSRIVKRVTAPGSRGVFGEGDIELLKSELETYEAQAVAARGDRNRALAELTRSTGAPLGTRLIAKPSDLISVGRNDIERLVRESRLPVQRRFQLFGNVARKRLEIARLDAFPAVAPQLGFAHHDDGANQVVAGVTIPLPFFNRNQAERLRAQGEVSVAEQGERYATSDAIVSEALSLYDAAQDTRRQADIYESKVLPAKVRAVDAYNRQFDGGAATAFQLWQAQRDLNEARRRSLELAVTLAETRAKLTTLVGQPQF